MMKQVNEADPSQAAGKKVGDYKFSPGEVMKCRAGREPAEVQISSSILKLLEISGRKENN